MENPDGSPKKPTVIERETKHLLSDVHKIHSLKSKSEQKYTLSEKIADWMTGIFGSMGFLALNILFFVVWLSINTGIIPGVEPFDPFPFGLLTTIVSLEAIILAICVLISQNRAERMEEVRQKVDLEVNLIAEKEMTKLLTMVSKLLEKQGIDMSQDKELQAMVQPTSAEILERAVEEN